MNFFHFFFKKHRAVQSQIHSVIIDQDDITDQDKINQQIFFLPIFSRKLRFQTGIIEAYLDKIPIPKLTNEHTLSCEGIISEEEVFQSLKSMDDNKSPGNDGLSKEFQKCFWDEVKKPFLVYIHKALLNQELRTSQKQAVINMLEKKDKDRRFIKN